MNAWRLERSDVVMNIMEFSDDLASKISGLAAGTVREVPPV